MLIILEGVDGAGKTTLATNLFDQLQPHAPTRVLHRGPMTGDWLEEYELDLEDYWPHCGEHIICDRWHVGELVYGPVLRGITKLTPGQRAHVEKFLMRRGAVLVHVTAPTSAVHRRLEERGDDLVSQSMIPDLFDGYYREFMESNMPVYSYITDGDNADDNCGPLLKVGALTEGRAHALHEFQTYVGAVDPSLLLLGETRLRHNGELKYPDKAAFTPRSGTSGEFLLRSLPRDVSFGCGIANALEEDIGLLWQRLGEPMIVALGKEAARECERAELPYGAVPHPQYVRRFHSKRSLEYGRAIREAALHRRDMTSAFTSPG